MLVCTCWHFIFGKLSKIRIEPIQPLEPLRHPLLWASLSLGTHIVELFGALKTFAPDPPVASHKRMWICSMHCACENELLHYIYICICGCGCIYIYLYLYVVYIPFHRPDPGSDLSGQLLQPRSISIEDYLRSRKGRFGFTNV